MITFDDFDLIPQIHKTLAELNYQQPTPIQSKAIPPALQGQDVLGCAQTGTGKTAAFALPILNRLGSKKVKAKPCKPIALVLAPTRELAIQIDESLEAYGERLQLRRALIYGGVGQFKQVKALRRGAHVVIATPGRLLDLMEQGYVDLRQLEFFVLDEVDRMLDMGFLPDLKRIISELPEKRQSLFFSATLPPAIRELANQLLRDPCSVNVTPKKPSVKKIEQKVLLVDKRAKRETLSKMLSSDNVDLSIVFTRTKRQADELTKYLSKQDIRAAAIHGNKSQNARQRALTAFQEGKVHVLVATDVASRGIDIEGISHVFNYDVPVEPESYVHRIGRTGRAGKSGLAVTFCTRADLGALRAIERLIGKKLMITDKRQPRSRDEQRNGNSKRSEFKKFDKKRRAKSAQEEGNPASPKVERSKKRKQRKGKNARLRMKQASA